MPFKLSSVHIFKVHYMEDAFSKVICLRLDIFFIMSCAVVYLCLAVKYIKFVIIVIFDLQILTLHVRPVISSPWPWP